MAWLAFFFFLWDVIPARNGALSRITAHSDEEIPLYFDALLCCSPSPRGLDPGSTVTVISFLRASGRHNHAHTQTYTHPDRCHFIYFQPTPWRAYPLARIFSVFTNFFPSRNPEASGRVSSVLVIHSPPHSVFGTLPLALLHHRSHRSEEADALSPDDCGAGGSTNHA